MTNSKTIVLVGGGHNGLVCATYLAKGLGPAGYTVQVLEARDQIGGAASTRCFGQDSCKGGFRVSAVAHVLHSLDPKIGRDLNLANAGLDRGPAIETISLGRKGDHLTLSATAASGNGLSTEDIESYASFKTEFRSYAKALKPLMTNRPPRLKNMDRRDLITLTKLGWALRFGLGANSMLEFLRVGGINIYDVLNEQFDSERLKGAIAADAVIGHHMGPRTPTTVLTYLHRLQGELHSPQTLPPGGMGKVTEALAEAARIAGVDIRTGAEVTRILVRDGSVTGVALASGERIDTELVVSNADAKTTFLKLVGTQDLDAMFAHRIRKTRTNGTVAKLHLGLNGLPEVNGMSVAQLGQRLLIAPDMGYLEHAFNHAKYGEFSEHPVLEITLPSITDASLTPDGYHVMSVVACFAPYVLKTGWDQGREVFADRIVSLLGAYFPGIASQIVARELLTPVDIEAQYNITGGHWHHGELGIDQSFMMRPVHGAAQYDTPVGGLFLCGAAAHPGGGVTGVPGRLAAERILELSG